MIASLPMYVTPRTKAAYDRFWAGIRDRLRHASITAPETLTHDVADLLAHWRSPDLVLSQTCGLPYRSRLREHVTLIGTPDYDVTGCPPGHYCSVIVVHADDPRDDLHAFRTSRFAFNEPLSQSGWAAVALELPWVLQGQHLHTGAHLASIQAVRHGNADFAAIDAVTFRNLTNEGETEGLRILHRTRPTPGLPLIAACGADAGVTFACVNDAVAHLAPADRDVLGIHGIISLSPDAYDLPIPTAPRSMTI